MRIIFSLKGTMLVAEEILFEEKELIISEK